jgi:hypothetical protein
MWNQRLIDWMPVVVPGFAVLLLAAVYVIFATVA